jgi:hypothetical protein
MYKHFFCLVALLSAGLQPAIAQDAREVTLTAQARTLPRAEVSLSNDTIDLRYLASGSKVDVDTAHRASGGIFISEERDILLDAELLFPANVKLGPVSALFGPRVYAALLEEENNDVMAFSIGTEVRLNIHRQSGFAVVGHAFYAPDILTFGTADNLEDFRARAEIRLGPRLIGFAGVRWFRLDLADVGGHEKLQDEAFVGAGYSF